ncbi:MAG: 7-carboxy-7-deazaguanine synthase QueE [Cocleimonas sp.]|nr:7-carboxy-7-deazaguanine synthase QueE [Cocleimonas sp.]
MATLQITEIFYSLQGESRTSGLPTIFIRLTGCPLRCHYCDTEYAFTGGEQHQIDDVLSTIKQYDTPYVTVTGGEPLAQSECLTLLEHLCDAGYQVSLETSGALSVAGIDARVCLVMDLKTPASGEADKNLWDNLHSLKSNDQIKFVICDREDYNWMKTIIDTYDLSHRCELLVSPSANEVDPQTLADWILQDQLMVRYQLQLHKLLWDDQAGH